MDESLVIKNIRARQVLDSRGNPTVEADVWLENGAAGRAIVPSGASTGSKEALELRDNDGEFYGGKSVLKAVWNVNHTIKEILVGNSAKQEIVDSLMREADGTENKSKLGANAILAVSLATAKAVAKAERKPFYRYVAELAGTEGEMSIPMPMINIMNGGAHADFATDFQEYMIIPKSAENIASALRISAEVFHSLKEVLKAKGYPVTVGDEGGYAPKVKEGNIEPFALIKEAVEKAGYKFGEEIVMAIDVAASEFCRDGEYVLKANNVWESADDLITSYEKILKYYPVVSIEDGLAEDDYRGWGEMTERLGEKVQLVGDDLFVTNTELLQEGIEQGIANAILIKPNQIGTLTETIEAVLLAKKNNYRTIISHRSGETEDTAIVHLAVGLGAGQIKTGSMSRSERICKYNELLRIAEGNPKLKLEKPFGLK